MYFQSYLANHPNTIPLHSFYDKYTIKDVVYILASIWKLSPITTLKRAWHNLNINIEVVDPVVEPNLPYQNIIPRNEIQSWLKTEEATQVSKFWTMQPSLSQKPTANRRR